MKRFRSIRDRVAPLTEHGSRPLRLLAVAIFVLVIGSLFLSPVNSLWSKNLAIRGEVSTRKVPDRCKDMHFDGYFWGTDNDDRIDGTSGNDMIWGLKGHDQIYGHGGSDCFDGGGDDDRCDDGDGWYDAKNDHSSYDVGWGEHEAKRNSCDQWGSHFFSFSWWHHSTPTIELTWGAVEAAGYYNVYRSTESGGPYTGIGSTPVPAYTDTGVLENVMYYYVITAVDADGFESVPSVQTAQLVPPITDTPAATGTPAPTVAPVASDTPAPPAGLSASYRQAGPAVDLTWSPVEGTAYYNVYRGDVAGGPYEGIGSSNAASFEDAAIAEGATYYYVVTAVDSLQAQSPNSSEAAVTTPSAIPQETAAPEQTPEPTPGPSPTATPMPEPVPAPALIP